jgi:hypothetical protein
VRHRSRIRGEPAAFAAPVAAHHVRGDAEQPRQRGRVSRVVARSQLERARERLGRDLLGHGEPDAPLRVRVDGLEVAVEDLAEGGRFGPGAGDRLGVGHVNDCPLARGRFHQKSR